MTGPGRNGCPGTAAGKPACRTRVPSPRLSTARFSWLTAAHWGGNACEMPLTDLEFVLFDQRNVLSRQQALRYFTPSAIRHRLSTSRWQQPHRAVYVTTTGALTWSQMCWVALLYAAPEVDCDEPSKQAFIAGRAALELHGVR